MYWKQFKATLTAFKNHCLFAFHALTVRADPKYKTNYLVRPIGDPVFPARYNRLMQSVTNDCSHINDVYFDVLSLTGQRRDLSVNLYFIHLHTLNPEVAITTNQIPTIIWRFRKMANVFVINVKHLRALNPAEAGVSVMKSLKTNRYNRKAKEANVFIFCSIE